MQHFQTTLRIDYAFCSISKFIIFGSKQIHLHRLLFDLFCGPGRHLADIYIPRQHLVKMARQMRCVKIIGSVHKHKRCSPLAYPIKIPTRISSFKTNRHFLPYSSHPQPHNARLIFILERIDQIGIKPAPITHFFHLSTAAFTCQNRHPIHRYWRPISHIG